MNKNKVRILGIDPGYGIVGFGVVEKEGNHFHCLDLGVIRTEKDQELAFRLNQIFTGINEIIEKYRPNESAIEKLFFLKNVTTAMAVSEARGVIQLSLFRAGVEIFEYTPFQVKQAVTGNGHAEKGQIQRVLKMILHLETTPKPDDAADAVAIALCHGNSRTFFKN